MKRLNLHIAVKALLYWYMFIFLSTELLSNLHLLERNYILLGEIFFWSIFLFFYHQDILQKIQKINLRSKSLLIILMLFLLTFIQGFFSAPNSTDSMVYHLPRVMYWVQEKTLFQDTIRSVHDYIPPFGHYILLHLYLILGNDRLLFFSQWIAYVMTVIIGGIIANQLGANRQISSYVSILIASIPVAAMQATSTKLEMLVAVLVIICTYIVLQLKEDNLLDYIALSISLGFGMLTKQTFLLYAIIPLGILLVKIIRNKRKNLLFLPLIFGIVLIINISFISKNLLLYDNASGPKEDFSELANKNISLEGVFSNLIKNTMLHIPVPFYNIEVENLIISFHKFLKLGVNDCSLSFCDPGFSFRIVPVIFPQEDIASNTFHLLLIVVASVVLFGQLILKKVNFLELFIYSLAILSYVFFSSFIKWQPFHSRMHLPFFVIGTIISVLILSKYKGGLYFIKGIQFVSVPLIFLLIFFNVLRPYISYSLFYNYVKSFSISLNGIPESFLTKPREKQYFNSRFYWYEPYLQMIPLINNHTRNTIAFDLMDNFEYPWWVLFKQNNIDSRIIPFSQINDDTLILSTTNNPSDKYGYSSKCIKTSIEYGYVCIYTKQKI